MRNPDFGPSRAFSAMLFFLLLFFILSAPVSRAASLDIDSAALKQQLADAAVDKLFNTISNASEEQLKKATYFDELLRDLEPLGIKLRGTSFNETARNIYNTYKEAYDQEDDPVKAREKLNEMLKGDIRAQVTNMVINSLDKGSQEAISDLQNLYTNAQQELNRILEFNQALEDNPDAEWTELAKKYGIKGEFLEKMGKLETDMNAAVARYGDYYKAGKIIYRGMSGHSGDKIEALFELGTEFSGKIPVLGRFVEIYFKVGQEMIKAVGRTGELLRKRQQGCLGGGTVGWIQTITSMTDERNVTFSNTYPNVTACPHNLAVDFYKDIYQNIDNSDQLYFWTGGGFVEGNTGHGGAQAVKDLRTWLKANGHGKKADDMKFIAQAYNIRPGFNHFRDEAEQIIDRFNQGMQELFSDYCMRGSQAYKDFVVSRARLQDIPDSSYDMYRTPDDWSYFRFYGDLALDTMIEERYIKGRAAFGNACKNAADRLEELQTARIEGQVWLDRGDEKRLYPGAGIEVSPMENVVEKCCRLTSDRNGNFVVYLFLEKSDSLSLNLRGDDGINIPDEATVTVSGAKEVFRTRLVLESKCGKDERLDKDGNCVPICSDGEELNADGECVPVKTTDEALDRARELLARARKETKAAAAGASAAEAAGSAVKAALASLEKAYAGLSAQATAAAELVKACEKAKSQKQRLQKAIQTAEASSDGHLATLKKSYAEATSRSKAACEKARAASNAKEAGACKELALRAMSRANAARQSAQNATAAAEKMQSLYNSIRTKGDFQTLDQAVRKIPAVVDALKKQVNKANEALGKTDPAEIEEVRARAEKAAADADKAGRNVAEILRTIRGLLSGADPSLAKEAQALGGQAEAVNQKALRSMKQAADSAAAADDAAKKIASISADIKTNSKEMNAVMQSLENCRNLDLGAGLNKLRTNSDMGEIFGPAAEEDAKGAFLCAEGAAEICRAIVAAGCRSDSDCRAGYVCDNGKCRSPFDDSYDDYADTMGQRDDDRSQDRADQVAADQSAGTGGGYTTADLDRDLDDVQDDLTVECGHHKPCPSGFVCKNGRCVEKRGCPGGCPAGHVCKGGKCVKESGCGPDNPCPQGMVCENGDCVAPPKPDQPATLAISPANKAVVVGEAVDFTCTYTDTTGNSKNVTAEASWDPAPRLTTSEIGVYTVTAGYQGLSAEAQVTVVKEKGMEDITVNEKTITVTYWDSGKMEDGDMIDILINGKVVFPGITLTFAKQSQTITMNADVIVVGFRALNEGRVTPNTATVAFTSVVDGKPEQEYELKKNQEANMNVTYRP